MSELQKIEQPVNAIVSVIERAASDPNVDISKMERLLDLQERILAKNAESAFNSDFAAMQGELPAISEKGEISVNGNVRSKYARFEDINEAVRPVLQKYGFSVQFKVAITEGTIKITGILRHRDGHSETTSLPLPADISGSKNAVQSIGSSVSYGKRYVLSALLNITTSGEDDDGRATSMDEDVLQATINNQLNYMSLVRDHFLSIAAIKEALENEAWDVAAEASEEIPQSDHQLLWKAPSKGGVWTTKERDQMKSNEFGQSLRELKGADNG